MRWAVACMLACTACGRIRFAAERDGGDATGGTIDAPCPYQAYGDAGSGTPADPFVLCNTAQWLDLAAHPTAWSAAFVITADFDLSGETGDVTPVGNLTTPFTGTMNGNHAIVSGYHNASQTMYLGLFGDLDGGGTITDLAVRDATIDGDLRSGALVGYINVGTVQRVASLGETCLIKSTTLAYHRGGLVGETATGGVVIDAFSTCTVKNNGIGLAGIVGHNAGSITNAYYASAVTLSGDYRVGGIAGYHFMGGSMANVFSAAAILGASSTADVGGVAGTNSGTMTNAYYDSTFSIRNAGTGGLSTGATAVDGSTGYFFDAANPPLSSWDFSSVWTAQAGTYPTLSWLVGR